MPYVIRKTSGDRPYKIVNKQTGEVVGSSTSSTKARHSIIHRDQAESKNFKKYSFKVDNKIRAYGQTDLAKHEISINKKKHKASGLKGELINTIVHEKEHVLHPKKSEKAVEKAALKKVDKMSPKQKQKHYKLFS